MIDSASEWVHSASESVLSQDESIQSPVESVPSRDESVHSPNESTRSAPETAVAEQRPVYRTALRRPHAPRKQENRSARGRDGL